MNLTTDTGSLLARGIQKSKVWTQKCLDFFRGTGGTLRSVDRSGSISVRPSSLRTTRRQPLPLTVEIRNTGERTWWGRGTHCVELLVEWKTQRLDSLSDRPRVRLPLPDALPSGAKQTISLPLSALSALGDFTLEISLGLGFDQPFNLPSAYVDVTVDEDAPDFELATRFDSADREAELTTQAKMNSTVKRQLLELGFNSGSKILDLGCGVGSLAAALVPDLNEAGGYCGLELSERAIERSRQSYPQANAHFQQMELTRLPLGGMLFDFIVAHDLFTHTFPAENRDLLLEAKRLLAPEGCLVAEFITSPVVNDGLGNRRAFENHHRKLFDLFHEVGLRCEELSQRPWGIYATRRCFKLTHLG
jgi:SAM-dependent methyltransferase